MTEANLIERGRQYASIRQLSVDWDNRLGSGNDGTVWRTSKKTAMKVYWREDTFYRELACYQRLAERKVSRIKDFYVPGLVDYDESLQIIEMDIVTEPYLLDFGKAYVDERPDYSQDALDYWDEQYRELWGDERWQYVKRLLASLTLVGIYYQDPTPRNISFGDRDD